jgi:hypothetical protein
VEWSDSLAGCLSRVAATCGAGALLLAGRGWNRIESSGIYNFPIDKTAADLINTIGLQTDTVISPRTAIVAVVNNASQQ